MSLMRRFEAHSWEQAMTDQSFPNKGLNTSIQPAGMDFPLGTDSFFPHPPQFIC